MYGYFVEGAPGPSGSTSGLPVLSSTYVEVASNTLGKKDCVPLTFL